MCFKVNLQDRMTGEVDGDTMLGTLLAEVRSEENKKMRIRVTDEDLRKEPPRGGNRKYKGPEYKILVWLPSGR